MHFATIAVNGSPVAAVRLSDGSLLEIAKAASSLSNDAAPSLREGTLQAIIEGGAAAMEAVRKLVAEAESGGHADARHAIKDIEFLAPIPTPRKNVFCVGRNYADHIAEGDKAQNTESRCHRASGLFHQTANGCHWPRRGDSDLPEPVRRHRLRGRTGRRDRQSRPEHLQKAMPTITSSATRSSTTSPRATSSAAMVVSISRARGWTVPARAVPGS